MTTTTDIGTRTVRKVLRRFLPILILCYFALYLDRLNLSVAALTMNDELGITPAIYGLVAGVFFWTYSLFEIPSNYIVSRVGVRVWVARIIVSWGLVTMITAAAAGPGSLVVLRLLLGVAEAGFSPAMLFFLASWIPSSRRAAAISLMIVSVPLSGIGTPISMHIIDAMEGVAGMSGWRWMFLITGLPPVILGYFFYRIIRNRPADAQFLNPDERAWLESELAKERTSLGGEAKHSFFRGLANPRVAALVVVYILYAFSLFGYQFFIPQILKQFGLSNIAVGWVALIPPLLAVGPMLWWCRHSDRKQERIRHFAITGVLAAVGFCVAGLFLHEPFVAFVGFCLAGIGLYCCMPIQLSIPSTFLSGAALAAGLATINGLGNIGGYFGPQVTGIIREATGGFPVAVLVLSAAILASALLALLVDRRIRRGRETESAAGARDVVSTS
ncbi:MFS transporter [Saccharomonospora sp. NPDC046836]|uniref:MFS transporter n=1 Tax=Saccharomonospora sp. NPDC046836 TaxID=3156921 RepID=UPI00340487CF